LTRRRHLIALLTLMLVIPQAAASAQSASPRVARLLRTLTVRQQVAQLVMPWLAGTYAAFDDRALDRARAWVDSLEVGGIIISIGSPLDVAAKLNFLQRRSGLPLLVASDLEGGTAIRFNGGTPFPTNMGVGATRSEMDAWRMGRITGVAGRAAGVHVTFSPVADVINHPDNPIMNTRAFGGDPRLVARFVAATVRGIQSTGMLATVKHFPGHGDTDVDSHLALPIIRTSYQRLDSLELLPFRAAIAAGVSTVMSAHIALPELAEPDSVPATLAPEILTGLLRDSLGFRGLVVTDALDMGALVNSYGAGEAAVRAFLAGSDLLLMPADPSIAITAMVRAVEQGRIPRARLAASVRRMLEIKEKAGLFARRTVNLDSVGYTIGKRAHRDSARAASARALVLVRDSSGIVDSLRAGPRPIALVSYADASGGNVGQTLGAELSRRGYRLRTFRLTTASGPASYDSAATVAAAAPLTVFVTSIRISDRRGAIGLPPPLARLIDKASSERPTMLITLGTPYLLRQVPTVPAYLIGWTANPLVEEAVAAALAGAPISGMLPIDLPPFYLMGHGVKKERLLSGAGQDR
jgi:beta-glucosidase-like glycosyl hydrolase